MTRVPPHTVRARPLIGTRYTQHSIELADGRVVHAQLSPYGTGEVAARVREFLAPQPVMPMPAFRHGDGKPTRAKPLRVKPGPKPGAKGRRGEASRDHSWLQGDDE